MRVVDCMWLGNTTALSVVCDCGVVLCHIASALVIRCPHCGRRSCWSPEHLEIPAIAASGVVEVAVIDVAR